MEVNIAGITGTVVRPGRLTLMDSDGNPIDGTYLDYYGKDTDFNVTVTTLNKKTVGISFDISQAVPEGYGLAAISYTPETVTIAGTQSLIRPIYNLDIPPEALNPDGNTGKIEQKVDISQYLDEGIVIPDADEHEIVVTMDIVPLSSVSYVVSPGQIEFQNIREGLEVDLPESAFLEVAVSGMEADLSGLTMEQIQVSADLSEYRRPGTYVVPVSVKVPEHLKVPEGLEVTVTLVRASNH